MEKLTAFFENFDLTKFVPQMDKLLGSALWITKAAVLAGPAVMLVFGLWYLLVPPKEANYGAGFRTWFGMGSVQAWRTTQKIAGYVWGGCGLVLLVVMWLISRNFSGVDMMQAASTAFTCLIWQAGVALVTYLGISITAAILFDSRGQRR